MSPSIRAITVALLLAACACSTPGPEPVEDRAAALARARLHGGRAPDPAALAAFRLVPRARAQTRAVAAAAGIYVAEHPGACPSFAALLEEGLLNPGPSDRDPWGRPLALECDGDLVRVCSAGVDGRAGSADDLCAPREPLGGS